MNSEPVNAYDIRNQVNRSLPGIRSAIRQGSPLPLLVTCKTCPVDILQWLKSHSVYPRLYWYDRDGGVEIGGFGSLVSVSENDPARLSAAFDELSGILDRHPQKDLLRFLGGTWFFPQEKQDKKWADFPALWFVLPQVVMLRENGEFFLSVGVLFEDHEDKHDIIARILESFKKAKARDLSPIRDQFPEVITRTDHPDYAGWKNSINTSLHKIYKGEIDKVVLARRTDVKFKEPVEAVDYVHALKSANDRCYFFLFQPRQGTAFLGATPERLLKIEKNRLISEAVSGTVARGADPDEDKYRGTWLLENQKELSEQKFVTDDLIAKFHRLTKEIEMPGPPEIVKLANVQHLVSKVSGVLRNGISIGEMVSSLHPTAAVGGCPVSAAISLIERLEPFSRGWYAGPVGILSHELTEMAVGIRSSLVIDRVVSLFTGAGIVKGSTPESEWKEIEDKMCTAFKILSGGQD
ncbi:MAG: isochorismate synthase [Deltaproteobacteria bacterium]|nr:isochorismate synthase [Deltaproteobacteria bacterium]